jgi:hypothetical protein
MRGLSDYQRNGDEWRRAYPADTPGLDICWQNFANCAELMLRQAAWLQPVPWRETLPPHQRTRVKLVAGRQHGPGRARRENRATRHRSRVFRRRRPRPWRDLRRRDHRAGRPRRQQRLLGPRLLTARLEWIGAPKAGVGSPSPAGFGPIAASRLETVTWEGWQLRMPSAGFATCREPTPGTRRNERPRRAVVIILAALGLHVSVGRIGDDPVGAACLMLVDHRRARSLS